MELSSNLEASLREEFQQLLAEAQKDRLAPFDFSDLAYLALVPAWTDKLAVHCRFPTGSMSLSKFLEQAETAGLCSLKSPEYPNELDKTQRVRVLSGFVPYLSGEQQWQSIKEAQENTRQIQDGWLRTQAFAMLLKLSELKDDERQIIIQEALATVREIQNLQAKADSLIILAPYLSQPLQGEIIQEALKNVPEIRDEHARASTLQVIIRILIESGIAGGASVWGEELLEMSLALQNVNNQTRILTGLIPSLSEDLRGKAIRQTLHAASIIDEAPCKYEALLDVSKSLTYFDGPDLLQLAGQAKEIVEEIKEVHIRVDLLLELAPYLSKSSQKEVLQGALSATHAMTDGEVKNRLLIKVAQFGGKLGDQQGLARLLSMLHDEKSAIRGIAAAALGEVGTTVTVAPLMERLSDMDSEVRRIAIQSLAKLISSGADTQVSQDRSNLVATLMGAFKDAPTSAFEIPPKIIQQVLEWGSKKYKGLADQLADVWINNPDEKTFRKFLPSLVGFLPERILDQALARAQSIVDLEDRVSALLELAPDLSKKSKKLMEKALQGALTLGQELEFWMPGASRTEVLDIIKGKTELGVTFLEKQVSEIGKKICDAQEYGVPVSPAVARWAELAQEVGRGLSQAARLLEEKLPKLIAADNTGEALGWLNIATQLADVLGGELKPAAFMGNHLLGLAYRRHQDRQYLKHFLLRPKQIEVFNQLLEAKDSAWAVHFIGMGGVGKTMLLRYLTSEEAPKRSVVTARVDFDHIGPDYPVRKPGSLLLALAGELKTYCTATDQPYQCIEAFQGFQNTVKNMEEKLSHKPPAADDPLANLHSDEFKKILGQFVNFLKMLPQPVVLILDTCEELTKAPPVGTRRPSLEATFEILAKIHQEVNSIRVIFAGRRPLALSGPGWKLPDSTDLPRFLPPKIDYLKRYEIRGFDEAEADQFLSPLSEKIGWSPNNPLRQAILQRSREKRTGDASTGSNQQRYNPFDLDLYAKWIEEIPSLTASDILKGPDPYIENRILKRLKTKKLQQLVPAVVLLRRFTQEMLAPFGKAEGSDFVELFRELGQQEWITYQSDLPLQSIFLEIDRNFLPRLEDYYYQHKDRLSDIREVERRLRPHLEELVKTRHLSKLNEDYVDAALRFLPDDQAADLWDDICSRIPGQRDWQWAANVGEFVRGEDRAAGRGDSLLKALVLATRASAIVHTQPDLDPSPYWMEVETALDKFPESKYHSSLVLRSLAGQIAAWRTSEKCPAADRIAIFWTTVETYLRGFEGQLDKESRRRLEQLSAASIAAVEACLEMAASGDLRGLTIMGAPDSKVAAAGKIGEWAERLAQCEIAKELQAAAFLLAGTAMAQQAKWSEAERYLAQAETTLAETSDQPEQPWDWRVPDTLADRIRLVRLHFLPAIKIPEADLLKIWQEEARSRLHLIDAERLVSRLLDEELRQGPISSLTLRYLEEELTKVECAPKCRPRCFAHKAVPPLFVTLAMGWLALGEGSKALTWLNDFQEKANVKGDSETVREAMKAKVRVIRRMRLEQRERNLFDPTSPIAGERALLWPTQALIDPLPADFSALPNNDDPSLIHTWWSSLCTNHLDDPSQAAVCLEKSGKIPQEIDFGRNPDLTKAALWLDGQEALLLQKLQEPPPKVWDNFVAELEQWLADHPTRLEEGTRLLLRAWGLSGRGQPERREESVGRRRMAELALEEGELLALRLPEKAVGLLDTAWRWFNNAEDDVGAMMAAILGVIARIRAGDKEGAEERFKEYVEKSYKKLADNSDRLTEGEIIYNLPEWYKWKLDVKEDPDWGGWLTRLLLCQVWATEKIGQKWPGVESWLKNQYQSRRPAEYLEPAGTGREAKTAPKARRSILLSICNGLASLIIWGVKVIGLFVLMSLVIGGLFALYEKIFTNIQRLDLPYLGNLSAEIQFFWLFLFSFVGLVLCKVSRSWTTVVWAALGSFFISLWSILILSNSQYQDVFSKISFENTVPAFVLVLLFGLVVAITRALRTRTAVLLQAICCLIFSFSFFTIKSLPAISPESLKFNSQIIVLFLMFLIPWLAVIGTLRQWFSPVPEAAETRSSAQVQEWTSAPAAPPTQGLSLLLIAKAMGLLVYLMLWMFLFLYTYKRLNFLDLIHSENILFCVFGLFLLFFVWLLVYKGIFNRTIVLWAALGSLFTSLISIPFLSNIQYQDIFSEIPVKDILIAVGVVLLLGLVLNKIKAVPTWIAIFLATICTYMLSLFLSRHAHSLLPFTLDPGLLDLFLWFFFPWVIVLGTLRQWFSPVFRATLTIVPVGGTRDKAPEAEVVTLTLEGWPLVKGNPAVMKGTWQAPGLRRAYREAAQNFPGKIADALGKLHRAMGLEILSIPLEVEPSLNKFPWEGFLKLALSQKNRDGLEFWRAWEAKPGFGQDRSQWQSGGLYYLGPQTWSLMLEKGWSSLGPKVGVTDDVLLLIPPAVTLMKDYIHFKEKITGRGWIKVLHLMGTPLETAAGLRFEIPKTRYDYLSSEAVQDQVIKADLIDPDQLGLRQVCLVILQGEPLETLKRFDREREKAALARAYAAALMTAGARAVITLPSLPSALAQKVLMTLARKLRSTRPPEERQLLTALHRVQRMIRDWEPRNLYEKVQTARLTKDEFKANQEELALDVCLFARKEPDAPGLVK